MDLTTVTMLPDGPTLTVSAGSTILGELERHGFSHRHGCRRGGCGMCKADIVSGSVTYHARVAPSVLTDDEKEAGTCLTCRAVPTSDVVLRLRDDVVRCFLPWLRRNYSTTVIGD